jgi:hypothetical protein
VYDFAVVALLALAALKVTDFLTEHVEMLRPFRSLLTFVLAIGGVFILDYSVFANWGIEVRNHAAAVWTTGFVVSGLTVAWRAVFSYLTHDRAALDESLGEHRYMKAA